MSYPTLMVHLELDRPNAGLLAMAGDLAGRLHSRVIGVATAQPIVFSYNDGYIAARQDRRRLRAWFDGSLPISTAGRGSVARPARYQGRVHSAAGRGRRKRHLGIRHLGS